MRFFIATLLFFSSNLYASEIWNKTSEALYYQLGVDKTSIALGDYIVKELNLKKIEKELTTAVFIYRVVKEDRIRLTYRNKTLNIYKDKVEVILPFELWK